MGYTRHHAIVVTTWNDKKRDEAYLKAKELFGDLLSPIIKSNINSYDTFFIAPDGSKEGWEESNEGYRKREQFIKWICEQAYSDGSNSLSYAELYYGDDNGKSEIVTHN